MIIDTVIITTTITILEISLTKKDILIVPTQDLTTDIRKATQILRTEIVATVKVEIPIAQTKEAIAIRNLETATQEILLLVWIAHTQITTQELRTLLAETALDTRSQKQTIPRFLDSTHLLEQNHTLLRARQTVVQRKEQHQQRNTQKREALQQSPLAHTKLLQKARPTTLLQREVRRVLATAHQAEVLAEVTVHQEVAQLLDHLHLEEDKPIKFNNEKTIYPYCHFLI